MGFRSGDIDLIRPGLPLDLTKIDQDALARAYEGTLDTRSSATAAVETAHGHAPVPELKPSPVEFTPENTGISAPEPAPTVSLELIDGSRVSFPEGVDNEILTDALRQSRADILAQFGTNPDSAFARFENVESGAEKILKAFHQGWVGVVEDPNMFKEGDAVFNITNKPGLLQVYEGLQEIAQKRGVDLDALGRTANLERLSIGELLLRMEQLAIVREATV